MFEEQPNKMQRLEDEYKVCNVGYHLDGEPMFEDSTIDTDIPEEQLPETEEVSGYPV